jgi:hypothetical protein
MINSINSTTYKADNLGDVQSEVRIGGSDVSKFIPNINSSFFDDEFFINLNRTDKIVDTEIVSMSLDKLSQTVGDETDEYYIDKEGRLKWDTIFSKCPVSMELNYAITYSEGIEFYYQGELKPEEIEEGCSRLDEIIGSYAVYCNKANNKHKTGKLCHIPRPFVIDAKGQKEWCVLKIDGNTLTITLPEKFMASAVYPVRLDPTIGYTSVGASTGTTAAVLLVLLGSEYTTASSDGSDPAIKIYSASIAGATGLIRAGYYTDATPYGLLIDGNHTDIAVSSTTPAWYTDSDLSGSIVSGTIYRSAAVFNANSVSSLYSYYDDAVNGTTAYRTAMTSCPANLDGTNNMTRVYSIYLEYTESGGTVYKKGILFRRAV